MLQSYGLRSLYLKTLPSQLAFFQKSRAYSSGPVYTEEEFDVARKWWSKFDKNTIPHQSTSKTTFTMAGGPGGQKTNKQVHSLIAPGHCIDILKDEFES